LLLLLALSLPLSFSLCFFSFFVIMLTSRGCYLGSATAAKIGLLIRVQLPLLRSYCSSDLGPLSLATVADFTLVPLLLRLRLRLLLLLQIFGCLLATNYCDQLRIYRTVDTFAGVAAAAAAAAAPAAALTAAVSALVPPLLAVERNKTRVNTYGDQWMTGMLRQ
jgi:hypothetical protein